MEVDQPPEPAPIPESSPAPNPPPSFSPAAITPPAPAPPGYHDRRTGMIFFGVAQIILGCMAALMVPFAALGAFMSRLAPGGATMRPGQYLSGIASYAAIAVILFALGIGSVQIKRWARALTLVISWYWMIMGVLITVLLTAVLPVMMRSALQAQRNVSGAPEEISTGVMAVIVTLIIVFCAFFLVLVPLAFIIFYSRQDVAETCRQRDPVQRWTDRAPLPVLGASVVLFTGALYLLLVGVTTPLFPFFGRYLTGIPAAACFLAMAALDFYLSIALFRLQSSAWWIAVLISPVRLFSLVLTYARADLMEAYTKLGWSDAQLNMLNANPFFRSHAIHWWSLISAVAFFGFLLWLKRYFKTSTMQSQPEAIPQADSGVL